MNKRELLGVAKRGEGGFGSTGATVIKQIKKRFYCRRATKFWWKCLKIVWEHLHDNDK